MLGCADHTLRGRTELTDDKGTPNGNMDLLAKAMRRVHREEVERDPEPAREDVEGEQVHPEGSS